MSAGYGKMFVSGLLLLLSSFIFVSLFSYHPNDPNLMSTGSLGGSYHNLCGSLGANVAELPIALVGLGAWLLPIYIAWEALFQRRTRQRRVAWLILFLSIVVFLGVIDAIKWPPAGGASAGQIRSGGWLGYVLWPLFLKVLGPVGLPLTLSALIIISSIVLAPTLSKAIGNLLLKWTGNFGNRSLAWLKSIPPRRYQAFIKMAKRSFLQTKQAPEPPMPELSAADGLDLEILIDHQEGVEALKKAEREAKNFKRTKKKTLSEDELPPIKSVHLGDIQIPENAAAPGSPFGTGDSAEVSSTPPDLIAMPLPKPAAGPIPPSGLLKGIPPPPEPKPPLVKPKISTDPYGLIAEQRPLGLTEPTPNQPLPEVPPIPGMDVSDRSDLPPISLFDPSQGFVRQDTQILESIKELIQKKLAEFKVKGRVTGMRPGPVVTVYEFLPDPGIALAKVMNMEDDLALGLQAEKVRIDRVLDKNVVGIEVPNPEREVISFRDILDSPEFAAASKVGSQGLLSLVLGKDIGGKPIVANLAKMPHLLIGGNTGSGKSVGVNAMICSILLRARPDEVKLIMVDPKIVELGIYEDIPHLWAPVVTDMKEAGRILKWVVAQMEDRYKCLSMLSVRDLEQFNAKVKAAGGAVDISEKTPNPRWPDRPLQLEPLPYVVVVIDELADLMMVCKSEVEESIARIAQKARAVGIHLILATQRPSVDIITGVIKANLPGRLSYRVNTKIDSRTILDSAGGEQLLGNGDALFLAPGISQKRIHGPWVTEGEILRLVEWLKEKGRPDYNQALMQAMEADEGDASANALGSDAAGGDIYDRAVELVRRERKASTSLLQRKLGIGYGRAARLIDRMEDEGHIGPDRGAGKPREVYEE